MDNKFKIFVIIALIILAVVAGTSTFMAVSVMNQAKTQAQGGNEETKEAGSENLTLVNLTDSITANIVDAANKPHVVRIVIALEVDTKNKGYKKFTESFSTKEVMVRDTIIYILRQQTYEMMTRQDAQEKLADEIVTSVNELLNTTVVQNVYFGDFFVQ